MGGGGGGEAAGVELVLEGSAVGLGGTASEVLDVVGEHRIMVSQVSGFPRTHFDDRLGADDAPSSEMRSGQAVATFLFCVKHSRQKIGRPWVGRKGTVVSLPHCEQVARVSTRE